MKIVCVSDIHGMTNSFYNELVDVEADILLFAGDICGFGTEFEMFGFDAVLHQLPFKHKIVVAGNHDFPIQEGYKLTGGTLLEDEAIEIEGIKIYGSPWSKMFNNWAYNLSREDLIEKWNKIPKDTDILLTHAPPFGILDAFGHGQREGCEILANMYELDKICPKLHVFGHIHESYGMVTKGKTTFINCSYLGLNDRLNKPIVIDYEDY